MKKLIDIDPWIHGKTIEIPPPQVFYVAVSLAEFKERGNFTNKQLALMFHVTRQTIANWLENENKVPDLIKAYLSVSNEINDE